MVRAIAMETKEITRRLVDEVCDFLKKLNIGDVELSAGGGWAIQLLLSEVTKERVNTDAKSNTRIVESSLETQQAIVQWRQRYGRWRQRGCLIVGHDRMRRQ